MFIVRCHNLIEISRSMVDFARMDETKEMPTIQFVGTKGLDHEQFYLKLEQRFRNLLSWLRHISPKILDVRQSTWYDDMSIFRVEITKLEVAVENLMEEVFKEIGNIEDAVQTLHGFRYFMNRENLQKQFDNKIAAIWAMLEEEIQSTKQGLIVEKSEYPCFSPYFGGRALSLSIKSSRLVRISKLLRDCTWQRDGETETHSEVFHHCDALVESINTQITNLYRKWLAEIIDNMQNRLNRYLMRRSTSYSYDKNNQQLECNIDPRLVILCAEADYWLDLKFQLPGNVQIISGRWRTLQFVYENVLAIVIVYNNIIQALSVQEKLLFRELIREVDKKIKPGLTKLTWNSEYIEDYIKDCNTHTANLQEFLDIYKKCNTETFKICENICEITLIKMKNNYAYELEELQNEMEKIRDEVIEIHIEKYNQIIQYLTVVFEGFESVIENSLTEWKSYLLNFDRLLKEAFKLSLKNSLSIMYEALHGDGTTSPTSVLRLRADLSDSKIIFYPALTDVARLISEVFNQLLHSFKKIPRLVEKFKLHNFETKPFWKVYFEDEDLDRSRQMLNNEVSYCFTQVQNYLTTWEPFRDIWEVNKDLFIQRYEMLKPTVTLFDADIGRYAQVPTNVQVQETVVSVHFLEINADRLKAAIVEQCSLWQQKLTGLLLRLTESKVHRIYKYVADNGKRIMKTPTDLISMQAALHLFERLTAEIPREEKEFPKIRQQYQTLEKYEVPMLFELKRNIRDIDECWASYLELIAACTVTLMAKKEEFKYKLISENMLFRESITLLIEKFYENAPFTSEWKIKGARTWLNNFRKKAINTKDKLIRIKKDLTIFGISEAESGELKSLLKDLATIELVWELADQWDKAWERYKTGNFWSIEIDHMEETANIMYRKLTRLSRELKEKNWNIVDSTRLQVDRFRRTLPLIIDLKNSAMRDRHWKKVMQTIGRDFDQNSDEFTLNAIADMQMHNFTEEIADISNAATMELAIEMGIRSISEVWKEMPIMMHPYEDKGVYKLKSIDEIIQTLEEHQVQLSAMKSTKFVEAFAMEVDYWERALSTVGEILEIVLNVQKAYMYLDNIFNSEDIRKQLPEETEKFDKLTDSWKEITSRMASSGLALTATHQPPGLFHILTDLNYKLEVIQRKLDQYLETKRHIFPRFYFISNDDLLEILANSKKPELIQPHIKKLFDGIKSIRFGKTLSGKTIAEGMSSSEGEYTQFLKPILLEGQVECWLGYIEAAMRDSLREILRQCRTALRKMSAKRDKWVKEWQSQPGIASTQIQWTTDCTRVLQQCKMIESKKPLKKLKRRQNQALSKYSEAVRGNLDRLQRLKFKAIVVIEIHARDVVEKMYKSSKI